MKMKYSLGSVAFLLVLCAFAGAVARVHAQTIETTEETGMQFDFHVPDAVLKAQLPPGWTPNVATQGPAKDANIRVIFMDRQTINGPDGKPLGAGSDRLVTLVAPVKDTGGAPVQLVIGGLTDDPANVPGPFGVYMLATTHAMNRSFTVARGPVLASQNWNFISASGERLAMRIEYERGVGNRGKPTDVKYCSAKNPDVCRISEQEQVLQILRNVTTNPPDMVKQFSFKASGSAYAKLFDGTEKTLSWDNILWITRSITRP